ncbi:hypothetical protein [Nocardioides sp. AE5]|uniref:hypothetical protein n=1 Tax=Nocardioides sp. AE5 TaxID=2962573 RepID=UPI002881D941|nr:hypothetical protein [Nocardioides sp. AE5]MDT0203792.1 hypothetical protein [Nocardioides sp. AE5]
MHRIGTMTGLLLGLLAGVVLTLTMSPSSADEGDDWTPPPETIIAIEGDAVNGFGIYHYDGTALFPPTDSEAQAECQEYDTQVERVRCRTEVRVWYRDLARMQLALRWAYVAAQHD